MSDDSSSFADEERRDEVPSHVYVSCPECAEETHHEVLKGQLGGRGGARLSATVRCEECGSVRPITVREEPPVELPVIVSEGASSRRTRVPFPADDVLAVGDVMEVEGRAVRLTGLELEGQRREEKAPVSEVLTVWAKDYEQVVLKFAINLGHKTITKAMAAEPSHVVSVGEEHVFGRLRVVVHAIKPVDKPIRRSGTVEAGEIVRVFARPARIGRKEYRPPKEIRDRKREREQDR